MRPGALRAVRCAWLASTIFILTAGGGCDRSPIDDRACTLIGCQSGLTLELEGAIDDHYTITATADGEQVRFVSCSEAGPCSLFFQDFTPSAVTITYESGGRTVEETFTPEYVRSQPNGQGCPPVCFNATVVLDLGS